MELRSAITHIRQWRKEQELPPLDSTGERQAAQKYLIQKGLVLPDKLPTTDGVLLLKDGVYTTPMVSSPPTVTDKTWEEKLDADLTKQKLVLYCDRIAHQCKLTGDKDTNGTFYIVRIGSSDTRRYPVKAWEIRLSDEEGENSKTSEFLEVNRASWTEIKNFLVERFIKSYPWLKQDGKTPTEVRAEMEAIAKSKNNGFASHIITERTGSNGYFENPESFRLRMEIIESSFPWSDFSKLLDFTPPKV